MQNNCEGCSKGVAATHKWESSGAVYVKYLCDSCAHAVELKRERTKGKKTPSIWVLGKITKITTGGARA